MQKVPQIIIFQSISDAEDKILTLILKNSIKAANTAHLNWGIKAIKLHKCGSVEDL